MKKMASAGRILIMPKGKYNAETQYEMLDLVSLNGTSWLAKKSVKGVEPGTSGSEEYWHNMFTFEIANNLDTTDEGKSLDARQGKILNERKQDRIVESVVVESGTSYELVFAEKECCLLCAYLSEPMYYSGIFACCGINAWSYSITKLNESIQNASFTAQIADTDGTDVNKIIFRNETGNDVTLNLIKLPF